MGNNAGILSFGRSKQGGMAAVCALFLSALPQIAKGDLDLDGDGASELWELLHPGVGSLSADSDGDGFSNRAEMIAGTDPLSRADRFALESSAFFGNDVELRWEGVAGKSYSLEIYDVASEDWIPTAIFDPQSLAGPRSHRVEVTLTMGLFRLVARDVDLDQDGLSAWEENLLGLSDEDAFSSDADGAGDYATALSALEQPEGVTLSNGQILPQRLPGAAEAARFLVQSSFGPTTESIGEVMALGMTGWLQAQVEAPVSLTRVNMARTGIAPSASWWRHGWWRTVLISPDQLRQRVAYALSQILVVNNEPGTVIGDNPITQAIYYDQFVTGSFGSYREILEEITYSPVMGFYLSHLNNRKSDPTIDRFPDENFAREIMQLFTIGLWELEVTGERTLDEQGEFIPTYNNDTIRNMAKVFTGMSHTRSIGQIAESFYDTSNGNDYGFPMKVWGEEHEAGAKILFQDVVIPDGLTGDEDVQMTLDALCAHSNMAPFISRLLIQRMTSSNPSSQYIARVTAAWNRSEGNLAKVVRAILLDHEARGSGGASEFSGKVREPLLRMIHLLRAFGSPETSTTYGLLIGSVQSDLGQLIMSSPTVFNFYSPDHSPAGELRDNGLFAPELEIATSSALLDTFDRLAVSIVGHFGWQMDYDAERLLAPDIDALLDHLGIVLAFGQMSPELRAAIRARVDPVSNVTTRVLDSVRYIVNSPNFTILK